MYILCIYILTQSQLIIYSISMHISIDEQSSSNNNSNIHQSTPVITLSYNQSEYDVTNEEYKLNCFTQLGFKIFILLNLLQNGCPSILFPLLIDICISCL